MKNYLNIVGIIACGVLVTVGSYQKRAPKPAPVTAASAFVDYQHRMSAAWAEGAGMTFERDQAAYDWIKGRSETERKAAFAPIHQREQHVLRPAAGEKYDDAKRQKLWATFAEESK